MDYKIATLICRAKDNNLAGNHRSTPIGNTLRFSASYTEVSYCSKTRASYYIRYRDFLDESLIKCEGKTAEP